MLTNVAPQRAHPAGKKYSRRKNNIRDIFIPYIGNCHAGCFNENEKIVKKIKIGIWLAAAR
jgi:hypothetical protein